MNGRLLEALQILEAMTEEFVERLSQVCLKDFQFFVVLCIEFSFLLMLCMVIVG